ncbi:hypothetical protein, partial [Clostridium sp. CMCC3677]
IADVFEDGEIDEDEEELLVEAFKLLVGAFIFPFGSEGTEDNCDDSSESMWDKAKSMWDESKNMAIDFTIGAGYSIDENMSFGMVMSIANKREEELPDSASCKAGRIFGDIWSLIGSGLEIGGGSAEAMGGVVLDSSGVGAVAGVPLNISGVAIAADGVINAERSLISLANDTMTFISNKSSNGGSGKSGSDEGAGKSGGVGNPVEVEGLGSTGRTIPNNLNEQMAMEQVKSNPLENAKKVPLKMNDKRWPASEGWAKMQSIVKNSDGSQTVIHFDYNKVTGAFDDFKFK